MNKLSDQIRHDFFTKDTLRLLSKEQQHTRLYDMSEDYVNDLIEKVKELEDKASRYDDFNECMRNWHKDAQKYLDKAAKYDSCEYCDEGLCK